MPNPTPSIGAEYRAHLQRQIEMEDDSTKDGFFRKTVLIHICHFSEWRESVDGKLYSLDSRTGLVEKDISATKEALEDFKRDEIKTLQKRVDALEKRNNIILGVSLAFFFIPNIPAIFKFLAAGSN